MTTVFMIHLMCCTYMVGLIWTIQLVHYPAFEFVALDQFKEFHNFHTRRITYVVLPVMVVELLTAGALAYQLNFVYLINFGLIILIWASTFFILVPYHNQLSQTNEPHLIRSLVFANWVRTALWTMRLLLLALAPLGM